MAGAEVVEEALRQLPVVLLIGVDDGGASAHEGDNSGIELVVDE